MEKIGNKTIMCSVLFLDIVEYSRKSVAGQISLKDRFNSYLSAAIRDVPITDRIILDTGDGAAINFLGDIEDALKASLSLRKSLLNENADVGLPLLVRMGINLGPVRLVRDINSQPNIVGDGINVAQRIMGFAEPDQILVSRSYYEAVSRLSPQYASLFQYQGSRTDKHVREHEVYAAIHPRDEAIRQASAGNIAKPAPDRLAVILKRIEADWDSIAASLSAATKSLAERLSHTGRRTLYLGVAAVSVLLVGTLAAILPRHDKTPALPEKVSVQAASGVPAASAPTPSTHGKAATASSAPPAATPKPAAAKTAAKKAGDQKTDENKTASPAHAVNVQPKPKAAKAADSTGNASSPMTTNGAEARISVSCRADEALVFVDNRQKGKASFGVLTFAIPPGKHTVLARHTSGILYSQNIELSAGQTMYIKPNFCD